MSLKGMYKGSVVLRFSLTAAGLAAILCGCGPEKNEKGSARAYRSSHRQQLIGGPAALAEIGDFILENDRVRAAILQPGNSVGPGVFGGNIIDVDLKRPYYEYQAGHGLDQFSELFPSANLLVPNPRPDGVLTGPNWDGPPATPPDRACPAMWPTYDDGEPLPRDQFASVCTIAKGDNYLEVLSILGLIIGEADFQNDVILRRGKRYFELMSTVGAGDGDRTVARPMCPFRRNDPLGHEPSGVLEAIVGIEGYRQGILAGDFLLFGKRLHVFVPGLGYDETSYIMDLFQAESDMLNNPVHFEYMVGVGDKVSYGLVTDRKPAEDPWGVCPQGEQQSRLLVPIETGAFTFVFTHWWRCPSDLAGCQQGGKLYYKRYFIVGEGDVASVLDSAYEIWKQPTGRLSGVAYEGATTKPVPHTKIFVLRDPVADEWAEHYPHADAGQCDVLRGSEGNVVTLELLEACAKHASKTAQMPGGQLGVVNEILTDRGDDPVLDGRFNAKLPPGSYYVVGYRPERRPSDAQRVSIREGRTTGLGIPMPRAGKVLFDIRDERGMRVPAKITVVGDCINAQGQDVCTCFPVTDPRCRGDGIAESGRTILEFGASRFKQGIVKVVHTATGVGEFQIPAGRYRFVVSRGGEYTIDEHIVDVPESGLSVKIDPVVQRVVDTTGWISGDFHVHGTNSYDAIPGYEERITSYMVENIELLSSSDHDWITDYGPTAKEMGVEREIKTQIGLELTTVEIGHFLAFPLKYDDNAPENGAVDWTGLTPRQIFVALRNLGQYGPDDTVITVAHPRDSFFGYFDQFGMSPYDLTLNIGLLQSANAILSDVGNFDPTADSIELINGKRYDFLRTPSNQEIRKFNICLSYARGHIANLPADFEDGECDPAWSDDDVSEYWVRRVLARTPEESAAFRFHGDGSRQCRSDADCVELGLSDHYCNMATGACSAPGNCAGDPECAAGTCNTAAGSCYLHASCDTVDPTPQCGAGLICDGAIDRCVAPCATNSDCHPAHFCCKEVDCGCEAPVCDSGGDVDDGAGLCVKAKCNVDNIWETTGSGADRPCVDWEGVVEDWFRLLNHGVNFTGLGNSDSHTLTTVEAGIPHNYICSSTDYPSEIDSLEIANNIQEGCVSATYGPFVEFWVNGQRIGSKVKSLSPNPLDLRIRVQSPYWFDVDRVEVYKNGSLWRIFTAADSGRECSGPSSSWPCQDHEPQPGFVVTQCECIPTSEGHNTDVVNMDVTFQDNPDRDAWYAVVAMGVGPVARTMSPIYTPTYYPAMTFSLIVNKALSSFDIGIDLSAYIEPVPMSPQVAPLFPYAITNPIWVDRDDAEDQPYVFTPPGGPPSWLMNAAAAGSAHMPFSGQRKTFRMSGCLNANHVRSFHLARVRAFFLDRIKKASLERLFKVTKTAR